MKQYATFYLNSSYFGIDVLLVREVNQNIDITPVDGALSFVRGLLNLRGLIITVLDPGVQLGLGPRTIGEETRCVVLKTNSELEKIRASGTPVEDASADMVGLLVDRIGDMITIDEKEIESAPANVAGVDGRFLEGVVKLDGELLITLRIADLLAMETT